MSEAERTAWARQIPGIPRALLYSEPMSVCRSIETPRVCGETERVQKTEAQRGHKRADHVRGRAFDSLATDRVWCQHGAHRRAL